MLKPSQLAPLDIEVLDEADQPITLSSQLGNWVVVYFYPKDDTPGCTVEACSLRDNHVVLKRMGVNVIGISRDNSKSHQKFTEKYQLQFSLWSDPEHKLLEAFGAWGEKKFMGKLFMGINRSTFIINPDGFIVKTFEKVTPKNHGGEIVEFLKTQIAEG